MLTATHSLGLLLLVLLVLGNKVVTLAWVVALMATPEVAVPLLPCSLVAVVTLDPLKVENAGVTGVVVDSWLLPLGPKTNLTF